jgi:hypothetical protein
MGSINDEISSTNSFLGYWWTPLHHRGEAVGLDAVVAVVLLIVSGTTDSGNDYGREVCACHDTFFGSNPAFTGAGLWSARSDSSAGTSTIGKTVIVRDAT